MGRNLTKLTRYPISPIAVLVAMIVFTLEMQWTGELSLVRFLTTSSLNNETLHLSLLLDSVRHKFYFSHTNLQKEPTVNPTPLLPKRKPPLRAVFFT